MGPRMNNRIFAKSVQVISDSGQNLGIMPTPQALAMAMDAGLDLVEINAAGTPPIVKIMDYGKFKYDQKKRANEARKNQKTVEMKEVWVKPFIEVNEKGVRVPGRRKQSKNRGDDTRLKESIGPRQGCRTGAVCKNNGNNWRQRHAGIKIQAR